MRRSRTATFAIVIVAALVFPAVVGAQSPCGQSVTVTVGDTLSAIAARCNSSVDALVRANPEVTNPDLIRVGQVLTVSAVRESTHRGADEAASTELPGDLFIAPVSGLPGTEVRLLGKDLGRNIAVQIGAGSPGSEPVLLRRVQTTSRGTLDVRVTLPEVRSARDRLVFVISRNGRTIARSRAFSVVESSADEQSDADGDEQMKVTGTVTDEGVECLAIRGEDGKLYTLTGKLPQLNKGDRVYVEGSVARISMCMQGTTLNVTRIERR